MSLEGEYLLGCSGWSYADTPDISLGLQGKGSVDVYVDLGYQPPNVSARIYENAVGGTKGFTLESIPLDTLRAASYARLNVPDIGPYRMNVGVRTIGTATITFTLFDSAGNRKGAVERTYPSNYYVQTSLEGLLPGLTPAHGDLLIANISGSAFVYGSTIDNTSQDPSLQLGRSYYLFDLFY